MITLIRLLVLRIKGELNKKVSEEILLNRSLLIKVLDILFYVALGFLIGLMFGRDIGVEIGSDISRSCFFNDSLCRNVSDYIIWGFLK